MINHKKHRIKSLCDNIPIKPARLGLVSTLYDQYTITHLTEALQNIYTKGKAKDSFKSVDSFVVEWDIQVKRIKRVPILRVEGDGCNGADILFYFPENYYQKFDTFIIEKTRDLIIVMNRPQRLRDNEFLVIGKINDSDYTSAIVPGELTGVMTRFVTNYMPELHEEGELDTFIALLRLFDISVKLNKFF